jgi:hypothetical protein
MKLQPTKKGDTIVAKFGLTKWRYDRILISFAGDVHQRMKVGPAVLVHPGPVANPA